MAIPHSRKRARAGIQRVGPASSGGERKIIGFSELVTAIGEAVSGAKRSLDKTNMAVADEYNKASSSLRLLQPPAFAISEVRLTVKFVIAEAGGGGSGDGRSRDSGSAQMTVLVDEGSLRDAAPHLISEFELRLVPDLARVNSGENLATTRE